MTNEQIILVFEILKNTVFWKDKKILKLSNFIVKLINYEKYTFLIISDHHEEHAWRIELAKHDNSISFLIFHPSKDSKKEILAVLAVVIEEILMIL